MQAITPESIALAAVLVSVVLLKSHVIPIFLVRQARYLLSPDPEFTQLGHRTHVNYLKTFKYYRNLIYGEIHTPAYQAIISTINEAVFGNKHAKNRPAIALRGGDGESEDELKEYRRALRQSSEPVTASDPPNVDTGFTPSSPPLPAIAIPGSQPVDLGVPDESEVEEEPPAPPPKKRPAPKKKVASRATLDDPAINGPVIEDPVLNNSIPGTSTSEPPELENPGRTTRGRKKKTTEVPFPAQISRNRGRKK